MDGIQLLAWLQSADGQKGRNRPTPIPRPGTDTASRDEAVSIDEMEAWLAERNPAQHSGRSA